MSDSELPYTKKVLKAAALTYVASAAAAILQLLRLGTVYLEEETVTDSVNTRELILGILMEVTKRAATAIL